MATRVLWVDDEPKLLEGVQRLLHRRYEIDTAESGELALQMLAADPDYDIIVSDMRMPNMDGIQFLTRARQSHPDVVRIMLTGFAEQQTAINAVNEGAVFRFLTKPADTDKLLNALGAAQEQRRLLTLERDLLQRTLAGAVKVLMEVLALMQPTAFGRANRLKVIARTLAERLDVADPWKVEVAAMLSQLGCITIPEATLIGINEHWEVSLEEAAMYASHPRVGAALIARIPRLEDVAKIVANQQTLFDTNGRADAVSAEGIPVGARILKVALDYDELVATGVSHDAAALRLRSRSGWYDPAVVAALSTMNDAAPEASTSTLAVALTELEPGMVLAEDIVSDSGMVVVAKGQEMNITLVFRLLNFARTIASDRRFLVYPPPSGDAPSSRGRS